MSPEIAFLFLHLLFAIAASSPSGIPAANDNDNSGKTFQATVTGYGPNCGSAGSGFGSCGFLGTPNSFQAAVSTYWNTPGLPGQCGTCWKLNNPRNAANGKIGDPIGTEPIIVMVDNTCAKDPSKPTGGPNGYQCNQNAQAPTDQFGSVTVVDLCHDTGAPDAFWGHSFPEGQTGGVGVADIELVDCEEWQGSLDRFSSWTGFKLKDGSQKQVIAKT